MHPAGIRVNITIEDVGILMAAQSKLPKQHPHDTQMCLSHALFLHSLPDGLLFLVPFFFAIISALLTQFLRVVTPGVVKPKIATPATPAVAAGGDAGSTIPDAAIPAADVEAGQVGGEDPPPYAPPPTPVPATSTPAPAEPAKPAVPRSSAQCFVQGTALLILMLFSILCLALSIGWMTHCGKESPWSATAQFFSWLLFFCAPAIWATFGLSCWAMLFRNLFGRAARKKYPFEENMMILGFFIMIGTPFFGESLFRVLMFELVVQLDFEKR